MNTPASCNKLGNSFQVLTYIPFTIAKVLNSCLLYNDRMTVSILFTLHTIIMSDGAASWSQCD